MESLYREMMEIREHLLRRIELLEDDVERLSEENYEYAREIYTLEKTINSLYARNSKFTHRRIC